MKSREEKLAYKKLKFVFGRLHEWAELHEPIPNDRRHGTVRRAFFDFLQRETKKLAADLDKIQLTDVEE